MTRINIKPTIRKKEIEDHADIAADWFRDAVVERWRGRKLVPEEW